MTTTEQVQIDEANAAFWDELCGTGLARSLGVTDSSPESLRRFDDWFCDFYPYLDRHLDFASWRGKAVLEVGLGYGTVSQLLAEAGADYTGLDIAPGPAAMVNHRLRQSGLGGEARQGSILDAPFPDESFDGVVAIGCYHHTGHMARAIDETWRVLKPGGRAVIMVYNGYGYRRWVRWPVKTARYALWDFYGLGKAPDVSAAERAANDTNLAGDSAPETVFVSPRHFKRLASRFSSCTTRLENSAGGMFRLWVPRRFLLATLGRVAGLDIYAQLVK